MCGGIFKYSAATKNILHRIKTHSAVIDRGVNPRLKYAERQLDVGCSVRTVILSRVTSQDILLHFPQRETFKAVIIIILPVTLAIVDRFLKFFTAELAANFY